MEIAYLAIRWQSWQTWLKAEKLTNIYPPAVGGLFGNQDLVLQLTLTMSLT